MHKSYSLLFFSLLALIFTGCQSKTQPMQAFKYHENAKKRPVVAMFPVINRTENYLSWNLSQEFTSEIQKRLMSRSVVYLNSTQMPQTLRQKLESEDAISLQAADFESLRAENDFAVVLELLEHSETPCVASAYDADIAQESVDRVLNMKMRVQVLDLRAKDLKVVLKEIKPVSHLIPRDYTHINYEKVVWGSDAYPATAYGRAHARLEKELANQIENYISIAH